MQEGATEAFRAVVTKQWGRGAPQVTVHGPYATLGAAKATRTREVGDFLAYGHGKKASGKIQRTTSTWVDIIEEPKETK